MTAFANQLSVCICLHLEGQHTAVDLDQRALRVDVRADRGSRNVRDLKARADGALSLFKIGLHQFSGRLLHQRYHAGRGKDLKRAAATAAAVFS